MRVVAGYSVRRRRTPGSVRLVQPMLGRKRKKPASGELYFSLDVRNRPVTELYKK